MKKMYLAVFLILLIAVVFCGCLSFSNTLTPSDDEETTTETGNVVSTTENNGNTSVEPPATSENEEKSTAVQTTDNSGGTSSSVAPNSSEFDILKSGTFYMKGDMVDSSGTSSPMEIAMTPSTMFVLSDFSGASMGILIKDKNVYMIYEDKKAYLELSESIMSMAGLDINELTSSGNINFSSLGSLSDADSVEEEEYRGKTCQVYHFTDSSGDKRIYMDGTKLMRIATYTSAGKFISSTEIDSISGTVPAGKSSPPSDYKAYKGVTGMFSFMTLIEDLTA